MRSRRSLLAVAYEKKPSKAFVQNWGGRGVYVAEISDYDEDLAMQLFNVCQMASSD